METIAATPSPALKERVLSIDVIRGFALLGILLVNIYQFGTDTRCIEYISLLDKKSGINYNCWLWGFVLFEGKMRGLFTLLFGAGIILFTTRKEEGQLPVADAYFRRMMWLLIFGLIDTYLLLWRGDVLYDYALCGILAFVFRNMRVRYLLLMGLICLYIFTYKSAQPFAKNKKNRNIYLATQQTVAKGGKPTPEQTKAIKEWEDVVKNFPPFDKEHRDKFVDDASSNYGTMLLGYADMFEKFLPDTVTSQSKDFYQLFWETFGAILIGMACFKLGLFSGNFSRKSYLTIMVIGLTIGYYIAWYIYTTKANTQAGYISNVDARPFSIFYSMQLSRLFGIFGYVGLLMLVCSYPLMKHLKYVLSCVGRMAITNYLSQTIICTLFFNAYGFGMFAKLQIYQVYIFCSVVWGVQMLFSTIWLHYFKMGPMEWLWRSLIYKKLIPNRIKNE